MIPVAIFARVSSDQQDYRRQISDLQQLATQLSYQVLEVITEIGSASKKSNAARPELEQLLQLARSGKIKKILVTEMSRLGRRPSDTRELVEQLIDVKVSVYSHHLGLETLLPDGKRNPWANIVLKVLEEVDWMETEKMSDRIKSGKRNSKKTQGRPVGTTTTPEQYITRYPKVVRLLNRGLSIREVADHTKIANGTVQAVKKAIATTKNNIVI